ncbi:hypothetical protein STVA_02170 [Allostella vacuolata]|nr:hypothetical protein STVA_02170 [Stella vacuolata]
MLARDPADAPGAAARDRPALADGIVDHRARGATMTLRRGIGGLVAKAGDNIVKQSRG